MRQRNHNCFEAVKPVYELQQGQGIEVVEGVFQSAVVVNRESSIKLQRVPRHLAQVMKNLGLLQRAESKNQPRRHRPGQV